MIKKELRIYINERGEQEATLAFSEKEKDMLCDFCSALRPPYRVYECPDFPHPMSSLHWSRGDWNACLTCAELIDQDDREALAERCSLMFQGVVSEEADIMMRAFHSEFFRLRSKSAPPEPKSDQPESPESHSSSHNPKDGSPDEDPSK